MWHLESERHQEPDLARFIATVSVHAEFFDRGTPITVARAPGRLDLMGGIADYSGALVLQLPLAAATFAAAQSDPEYRLTLRSLGQLGPDADAEVTIPLAALVSGGTPLDYAAARTLLTANPRQRWTAYVAGAMFVLVRERGIKVSHGVRILIDSEVPLGKGVSSSAALEVAAMTALCAAYDVTLDGREVSLLCQMVENLVVGAPCGVMDQMTATLGERDRLLALLCQPAELQAQVTLPTGLEVWGIDSGIRHQVGGTDYGAVRVGAFMGYRFIAEAAGLTATTVTEGCVQVNDPKWRGYLANVTPSEWVAVYQDVVPEVIDGASFLRRYGGTTDSVSRVDPRRMYAVRQPTAHPIYEHHRVRRFRALFEGSAVNEAERLQLGELMFQSHASYSACGLGSSGTDTLVELVRAAGPKAALSSPARK